MGVKRKRQWMPAAAAIAGGLWNYYNASKKVSGLFGGSPRNKRKNPFGSLPPTPHGDKIRKITDFAREAVNVGTQFNVPGVPTGTQTQRKKKGSGGGMVGGSGVYKGKFKRKNFRRGVRNRSFGYNGSIYKTERGGEVEDSQCVYVGHAVAFDAVLSGFFRAIINTMFTLAQEPVNQWSDLPASAHSIYFIYREEAHLGNNLQFGYVVDYTKTFAVNADLLMAAWNTNFGTGKPVTLVSIRIVQTSTGPGDLIATIMADQLKLSVKVISDMTVQNITLSGPDPDPYALAVPAQSRELADNIMNNPVKGKLYATDCKGNEWRNGFLDKKRKRDISGGVFADPDASFIADASTGVISAAAATQLTPQYYKPVDAWEFDGRVKSQSAGLDPGAIKKDSMTFTCTMSINGFIAKYAEFLNEGTTGKIIPFGFARLYGLEKRLDSRTGTAPVKIHYELNQSTCVKLFRKKKLPSLPYLNVTV